MRFASPTAIAAPPSNLSTRCSPPNPPASSISTPPPISSPSPIAAKRLPRPCSTSPPNSSSSPGASISSPAASPPKSDRINSTPSPSSTAANGSRLSISPGCSNAPARFSAPKFAWPESESGHDPLSARPRARRRRTLQLPLHHVRYLEARLHPLSPRAPRSRPPRRPMGRPHRRRAAHAPRPLRALRKNARAPHPRHPAHHRTPAGAFRRRNRRAHRRRHRLPRRPAPHSRSDPPRPRRFRPHPPRHRRPPPPSPRISRLRPLHRPAAQLRLSFGYRRRRAISRLRLNILSRRRYPLLRLRSFTASQPRPSPIHPRRSRPSRPRNRSPHRLRSMRPLHRRNPRKTPPHLHALQGRTDRAALQCALGLRRRRFRWRRPPLLLPSPLRPPRPRQRSLSNPPLARSQPLSRFPRCRLQSRLPPLRLLAQLARRFHCTTSTSSARLPGSLRTLNL